MPGDKSLTQRHVNCLSVLCYPSYMSRFGHCYPVGGRPLCQLLRDFCKQWTMEHCYDWLDMDIDMDRHWQQPLWRHRLLVDKLIAHSLMDGLPWRSMHESYRLTQSSVTCPDVRRRSGLRMISMTTFTCMISTAMLRITHDFFNDVQNHAWLWPQRPISHIIAANCSICWLYLFLDPNLIDAHLLHGVSSIGKGRWTTGAPLARDGFALLPDGKKDKLGDVKNDF